MTTTTTTRPSFRERMTAAVNGANDYDDATDIMRDLALYVGHTGVDLDMIRGAFDQIATDERGPDHPLAAWLLRLADIADDHALQLARSFCPARFGFDLDTAIQQLHACVERCTPYGETVVRFTTTELADRLGWERPTTHRLLELVALCPDSGLDLIRECYAYQPAEWRYTREDARDDRPNDSPDIPRLSDPDPDRPF